MISVIIPTYKEGRGLLGVIDKIQKRAFAGFEIIVSDSTLGTSVKKMLPSDVKYVRSKKGRALQMNKGASVAKGDEYLFLHADTIVPKHWDMYIRSLVKEGYTSGGFLKEFKPGRISLRMLSEWNNIKTVLFKDLLGDNAMFISSKRFKKLGGFKEMPLMEDVELCSRLTWREKGIVFIPVITDSRRFIKQGVFTTIWKMMIIRLWYFFGVDVKRLAVMYR